MKSGFARLTAALALLASQAVAHYTFPDLVVGGKVQADWSYIRMANNHYSNGPVTDVTDPQMKCYESTTASATSTYTVAAGSSIGINANGPIYHPGYLSVYMSSADAANDENAGSGASWFKIYELTPTVNPSTGFTFPSQNLPGVTFTIPSQVPSGQYLVRIEHIALHSASAFGGAQFYISCAQIQVTGGGSGSPGPLVAIPGVYTGHEPGILLNIYGPPYPSSYTAPGPSVWPANGVSGGNPPPPPPPPNPTTSSKPSTPVTTTPAKPPPTTSSKPPTTSSGTGVALYGQCGGEGYTGSTTCASGVCTVSNPYYSQCLPA